MHQPIYLTICSICVFCLSIYFYISLYVCLYLCACVRVGLNIAEHHHHLLSVEHCAVFPEGVHPYNKVSEAPVHTQLRPRIAAAAPTRPALQAEAGAASGVCVCALPLPPMELRVTGRAPHTALRPRGGK